MTALVIAFARAWVRLYTRGLPAAVRDARRSELESDLWEQRHEEAARGRRPAATALRLLGRAVRGAPADLAWRFEQRDRGAVVRRLRAAGRHGWTGFPAFVALAYLTVATGLGTTGAAGPPEKLAMGAGAAAILCGMAGLWRGSRRVAAAWLVCLGALVPALVIAHSAPLALLWAMLAGRSAVRRSDALRAGHGPSAPA